MFHRQRIKGIMSKTMFYTRIVTVDHYQSFPTKDFDILYSDFRGCEVYKVPVIRIFGVTPAGQKSCLHVHNVFPYIYIPCDEEMPRKETDSNFRKYTQELALSIDKSLNVASMKSSSYKHHVYKISLISGIPFYGYYEKEQPFLKIYFYNPNVTKKVAELFAAGAIMNKVMQPYEAHIPYILQFFIDYNLFGMNFIKVKKFKFRESSADLTPLASSLNSHGSNLSENAEMLRKFWCVEEINSSQLCSKLNKQTYCELEADCSAIDILNRLEVHLGRNPGLQAIWDDERHRRQQNLNSSELTPAPSQDRTNITESSREVFYKKRLEAILHEFENKSLPAPEFNITSYSSPDCDMKGQVLSQMSFSGESSLCDTQDKETLNYLLCMANEKSDDVDHDSILSLHTLCNEELDAEEEAISKEMSQCMYADDNIFSENVQLSSEQTSSIQHRSAQAELFNGSQMFSQINGSKYKFGEDDDSLAIPQLDGAGDEDCFKLGPKHPKALISPHQCSSVKTMPSLCSPFSDVRVKIVPLKSMTKSTPSTSSRKNLSSYVPNSFQVHQPHYPRVKRRCKGKMSAKRTKSCEEQSQASFAVGNSETSLPSDKCLIPLSVPLNNMTYRSYSLDEKNFTRFDEKKSKLSMQLRSATSGKSNHKCFDRGKKALRNLTGVTSSDAVSNLNPKHSDYLKNVDFGKIGHEVLVLKRLSEADIQKFSRSSKNGISDRIEAVETNAAVQKNVGATSPSLKMKLLLKWVITRSNDPHVSVLDKEFNEPSSEEVVQKPLKLKYPNVNSIGSDSSSYSSSLRRKQTQKQTCPMTRKFDMSLQNKNPSFRSPLMSEYVPSYHQKQVVNKGNRKHGSFSKGILKSSCRDDARHPSDVQKEKLSRLNLTLTRNKDDGFNCYKSERKVMPKYVNEDSPWKMNLRKQKKSAVNGHSELGSPCTVLIKSEVLSDVSDKEQCDEDTTGVKKRVPKLHLKNTGDQWSRCKSRSGDTNIKTVSKRTSHKSRRCKKKSFRKSNKVTKSHCHTDKNLHMNISNPDTNKSITPIDNTKNLMRLCKPFSIVLSRLTPEMLVKYNCVELSSSEQIHHTCHSQEEKPLDAFVKSSACIEELSHESYSSIQATSSTASNNQCSDIFQLCLDNSLPLPLNPNCALNNKDSMDKSSDSSRENTNVMRHLSHFSSDESVFYTGSPPCFSPNLEIDNSLSPSDIQETATFRSNLSEGNSESLKNEKPEMKLDNEHEISSFHRSMNESDKSSSFSKSLIHLDKNVFLSDSNSLDMKNILLSRSPSLDDVETVVKKEKLGEEEEGSFESGQVVKNVLQTESLSFEDLIKNIKKEKLDEELDCQENVNDFSFDFSSTRTEENAKSYKSAGNSLDIEPLFNEIKDKTFSADEDMKTAQCSINPEINTSQCPLLYERLTGEKCEIAVKREEVESTSARVKTETLNFSSFNSRHLPENSDIFLPSTQLSFYSTLDDVNSSLSHSSLGAQEELSNFHDDSHAFVDVDEEEKNLSLDLFSIDEDIFQPCNYENISSSSECHASELQCEKKCSTSNDSCTTKKNTVQESNSVLSNTCFPGNVSSVQSSCDTNSNFFKAFSNSHDKISVSKACNDLESIVCHSEGVHGNIKNDLLQLKETRTCSIIETCSMSDLQSIQDPKFNHESQIFSNSVQDSGFKLCHMSRTPSDCSDNQFAIQPSHDFLNLNPKFQKNSQHFSNVPSCILSSCSVYNTTATANSLHSSESEQTLSKSNVISPSSKENHMIKTSCRTPNQAKEACLDILKGYSDSYSEHSLLGSTKADIFSVMSPLNIKSEFEKDAIKHQENHLSVSESDDILSKIVKSCNIDMEFGANLSDGCGAIPASPLLDMTDELFDTESTILDCGVSGQSSDRKGKGCSPINTHFKGGRDYDFSCNMPAMSENVTTEKFDLEKPSKFVNISENLLNCGSPPKQDSKQANLDITNDVSDQNSSIFSDTHGICSFYGDETIYSMHSSFENYSACNLADVQPIADCGITSITPDVIPAVVSTHKNESFYEKRGDLSLKSQTQYPLKPVINSCISSGEKAVLNSPLLMPKDKPPTRNEVLRSSDLYNIPDVHHLAPFFSDPSDKNAECNEMTKFPFSVKLNALSDFESSFQSASFFLQGFSSSFCLLDELKKNPALRVAFAGDRSLTLTPSNFSPSLKDVKEWLIQTSCVKEKNVMPQHDVLDIEPIVPSCNSSNPIVNDFSAVAHSVKFPTLSRILKSPVISKNNILGGKNLKLPNASSSPHFSTPVNLKPTNRIAYRDNLMQPKTHENFEGEVLFERDTHVNNLKNCFPLSPIVIKGSSVSSCVLKKRKLDFNNGITDKSYGKKMPKKTDAAQEKCIHSDFLLLNDTFNSSSSSQIEGPTLENSGAFKVSLGNISDDNINHEHQHLTVMSLEIHVNTRIDLRPDPQHDPISVVFYCISKDSEAQDYSKNVGIIAVDDVFASEFSLGKRDATCSKLQRELQAVPDISRDLVFCVKSEEQLFEQLVSLVQSYDPDILLGYEIEMLSLGYLVQRASHLNVDLNRKLSRLIEKKTYEGHCNKIRVDDESGSAANESADLQICGRIILNVWRLMRKEVTLNVYTFENVFYHVLHKRTPKYSFQTLTKWYQDKQHPLMWRVINYYGLRVVGNIQLLDSLNVIQRTSELARVFGIQFYEVLSRGSQFRVESMMLRTAKPCGYIPVSPTVQQRSVSSPPQCVPLIFEPESGFYIDPVLVLDFQSLYPSMIIAYNYCFSTCLGRVDNFGKDTSFKFGCTSLSVSVDLLQKLKNDIHISPNGVAFVKSSIRRGILPLMLEDILNTRIMVKQSLKLWKLSRSVARLLDARQLGLKLIANVTYGYTSANFSGRMPCVEIADSIVEKGRETLERAIHLIENTAEWKAKVVYGDTDSVFVLLPGRSKEQAFKIGQDIADAVTAMNPKPVKLKFEKVYLPSVLQTKKRYVGYMYETLEQKEPIFDAKGIETVRRDSCGATAKILEKSLKILFNSRDVSHVKKYVQKQFRKLLSGRANMMDCIFAKEYRGRAGYRPKACVPALEIAKKSLLKDPRSEPRVGERVPYVIVYGFPGLRLIELIKEPDELLKNSSLRINAKYYITHIISPPLDRVFSLIGVDVKQWYKSISYSHVPSLPMVPTTNKPRGTLSQFLTALSCPACEKPTNFGLCNSCQIDSQTTSVVLKDKIRQWERTCHHLSEICRSCTKSPCFDSCISLDCPILFRLNQAQIDLSQAPYLRNILLHELF